MREVPSEWEGRLGELAGKRAIRPGTSELTFGYERGRDCLLLKRAKLSYSELLRSYLGVTKGI